MSYVLTYIRTSWPQNTWDTQFINIKYIYIYTEKLLNETGIYIPKKSIICLHETSEKNIINDWQNDDIFLHHQFIDQQLV